MKDNKVKGVKPVVIPLSLEDSAIMSSLEADVANLQQEGEKAQQILMQAQQALHRAAGGIDALQKQGKKIYDKLIVKYPQMKDRNFRFDKAGNQLVEKVD